MPDSRRPQSAWTTASAYVDDMRITHLGHACLLVEAADQRILIDPGTFTPGFEDLADLDAILVTHQHPDHVDVRRLPALLDANPEARLLTEPQTAALLVEQDLPAQRLAAGEAVHIGPVEITPVGQRHAMIHEYIPRIDNLGVVLRAAGEPSLFHPGDAYDAEPGPVDLLAVPINAPWCAVKETIAFVRRVGPRIAIPIHDGLVAPAGRQLYVNHTAGFGPEGMELRDLADRQPAEF